ncbi:MAG: thioredoxin [Bacteroidetes bacterium CG_4_10_14_3_um_filter_31_20]|nr:MAG: thioredoxin [Bacteroidetes bacterium CG_4_10_14_3_um_filter_31_20]
MKTIKNLKRFFVLFILANVILTGCAQSTSKDKIKDEKLSYKVTFIELGSVKCIPCQQMQVVIKSIREKYEKQVKVIFYDVWTPEGKPFATQYNINLIPTQVLLDENGKEFFRHEGYFPEEELVKMLKTKGVK